MILRPPTSNRTNTLFPDSTLFPSRPGAAFGHHRGKIIDQELAARNAAPHRGEGQRHADHADRRLHHVDERLVDPFRLRAPGDTEEAGRGKIERPLLDRRIEWKGSSDRKSTRLNSSH